MPRRLVASVHGGEAEGVKRGDPNHPFFRKQLSVVLANSGQIDPERIESYIAAEGYRALHAVLREMTPQEVVETIDQERAARARRRRLPDRA